jgi:alanine dehydrogenase
MERAMKIGVPKEIKDRENRVGLTPAGVATLIADGHQVVIETGAGVGSGFGDAEYSGAGATLGSAEDAWNAQLVIKIKEPLASEYHHLRGQIVFTYFHLAGVAPELTKALLDSETTAVAYETVEDASGTLPLLAPMSAVAGTMSVNIGGYYLARVHGGRGMLLGRVLGQRYGKILVIGDGVVGRHAAAAGLGVGARVLLAGRHEDRVELFKRELSDDLEFVLSTPANLDREMVDADLVVGAVLLRGGRTPHLVSRDMVAHMQRGSVIVDVSIDQGGCVETSRPTSHSEPVYLESGVIHYCVTNMPGAYPRTSTIALTTATLPYARRLAAGGIDALRQDAGFAMGVNTYRGKITYWAIAKLLDMGSRWQAFSATPSKPSA